MDRARLEHLRDTYRNTLLDDVLPFWIRHCVDREHGGFSFCVDHDGTVVDTDKGMWQQARFTWLLGTLCSEVDRNAEWLELCEHGIAFLRAHGFDDDGRMFFHVTRDGLAGPQASLRVHRDVRRCVRWLPTHAPPARNDRATKRSSCSGWSSAT